MALHPGSIGPAAGKRKAVAPFLGGGNKGPDARLVSGRIVLPRRAQAPTKMGDFSQARPRASLARKGEGARGVKAQAPALLSCPTPGRPPRLDGEAARPSLATKRKGRSPKAPARLVQ